MYFLISSSKDENQTFCDLSRKRVARLTKKNSPNENVNYKQASMFGAISISNVLISKILVDLNVSILVVILFVYIISILTGIVLFQWTKNTQTRLLDKNAVDCSSQDIATLVGSSSNELRRGYFQVALGCLLFGLIMTIFFYFNSTMILSLVLIWIINVVGVLLLCEPLLYYFLLKTEIKAR
ncbi:hypothetical protein [Enterococcus sp. AZ196]|uniref:hypothetical protein n=1 Tax=Enterococcus sp. AZ196 TaxID=2774659 RepID=UPI003D2A83E7